MIRGQKILFWTLTICVLLLFAGVLLPSLAGSRESVAVIRALPLGWLNVLRRTLPEVTVNWAGIGMVVLCSTVILACLHSLMSALTQKRFRFRWSISIFASVWLLFCLIIAVAGLSRTAALLKTARWYQVRFTRGDLRNASFHASMILRERETDLSDLKPSLMRTAGRLGRPLWEEFEFLLCPTAPGTSACIVVIPRDPKARERIGFSVITGSGAEEFLPITKLQETLGQLRISAAR